MRHRCPRVICNEVMGFSTLSLVGFFSMVLLVSIGTHVVVVARMRSFRAEFSLAQLPSRALSTSAAASVHTGSQDKAWRQSLKEAREGVYKIGNRTEELYTWMQTHLLLSHNEHRPVVDPAVTRVCIPISITTRGTKWKKIEQMLLLTSFLPSLVDTTEAGFHFGVYLGYDEGDPLLDSDLGQETLQQSVRQIVGSAAISVKSFRYADSRNRNVWAVNYISRECYLDDFDYFYRVNDDSAMQGNWASTLVFRLR